MARPHNLKHTQHAHQTTGQAHDLPVCQVELGSDGLHPPDTVGLLAAISFCATTAQERILFGVAPGRYKSQPSSRLDSTLELGWLGPK